MAERDCPKQSPHPVLTMRFTNTLKEINLLSESFKRHICNSCGLQIIRVRGIRFQAEMSMWNIFDQSETYGKNGDDQEPMKMLHGAAGLFWKSSKRNVNYFELLYYFVF